ncbi:hypothetical protein ACXYTJ_01465 [Gilvimarinus sp. F26214L]|uniref:hypothetical protein n=1 Tax=Gilvimarinus sp. DZF01 TaxID=3461371 RepID=UPI004045595D
MTKRENRDSYLSEEQVMGRVIDTCDKISQFLATLREHSDDARTQLHIDNLIQLQDELTGRIAEYRQTAPSKVKNTYMQYVDPGSGKVDEMIAEHGEQTSLDDVTNTILALNGELAQELEHVSINEGIEESRDAFGNLQALIEDTCHRMSVSRSMADDM